MRGPPPVNVDVLFAAYGGGHVNMLLPVAEAVAATGRSIGFLGLTTAQAKLDRHGADYFGYAELDGADDAQVQLWGQALSGPEVADSPVSYRESVAYHGLNFRDLVTTMGEAAAHEHYATHGRQGFLPVPTMQRLLQVVRPRVVVVSNSPRTERALLLAARNAGIPVLCLVDLFGMQETKWISGPAQPDLICVLNEQVRARFIQFGCAPDRVVVTGNPAFDTLGDADVQAAGTRLRQLRGFGATEKVILWASNVEPERHPFTGVSGDPTLPRRIEAELRRLTAIHDDWRLIVRYHPSETVSFQAAPKVAFSERAENLHALIHSVDIVVVMSSTVGLEAHLAGKPVVSLDMSIFTPDAPYSTMGVSTGVTQLDALESAISTALLATDARVSPRAGTATTAVAAQISSLLSR